MSTVNLKKLAVGMRTIEDLEMRLKFNIEKNGELIHITRNKPKRSEELCNGGSLFWVINRRVLVRQKILNIKQIIEFRLANKNDLIKILGRGKIEGPVKIFAHKFSITAKASIEAAGGEAIIV